MESRLINKGVIVYFGAGGAGIAYCKHSKTLPDFFVDNDSTKHGKTLNGVEIKNPDFLRTISINKVVITSGYVKDILPQLLDLGIDKSKIHNTPKSYLGTHIFKNKANRIQVAGKLHNIMKKLENKWKIVAVGGTALGFARDNDFIHWDVDIDLFAPYKSKSTLINLLDELKYSPTVEKNSIKANIVLDKGTQIPLGIDLFNSDSENFIDRYEDYNWTWPTKMFVECTAVEVHGYLLNLPSPINKYLTGVYGSNWSTPNPNFGYSDYTGNIS